jgi:hypothetical protein
VPQPNTCKGHKRPACCSTSFYIPATPVFWITCRVLMFPFLVRQGCRALANICYHEIATKSGYGVEWKQSMGHVGDRSNSCKG